MSRPLRAQKFQGALNDFLFVEAPGGAPSLLEWGCHTQIVWEQWVQRACHRRRGFGADGVVVWSYSTGEGESSTAQTPLTIAIFNADGSRAATCGNALRCLGLLLLRCGHWDGHSTLAVDPLRLPWDPLPAPPQVGAPPSGPMAHIVGAGSLGEESPGGPSWAQVSVSMGGARRVIPTPEFQTHWGTPSQPPFFGEIPAPKWSVFVQLANNHWVFAWEQLPGPLMASLGDPLAPPPCPLAATLGAWLQSQDALGQVPGELPPANIGFLGLTAGTGGARPLVVYELGAGLTPSCGSGATAAAVALEHMGCAPKPIEEGPLTFSMPGGTLGVAHRLDPYDWVLVGPCHWVGACTLGP